MNQELYRERLKTKSLPQLKKLATENFNAFIRERDKDLGCVSCGSFSGPMQAGHYYSAGHHPGLRFNIDNCHNQCVKCNMYLSGNLIEYRKGLLSRIGAINLQKLEDIAAYYKRNGYKHDKQVLIEIIIKHK